MDTDRWTQHPAEEALASVAAPHRLQPADLGSGLQLVEFDATRASKNLERLAADVELLEALMWAEYQGPTWLSFQRALAEYGFQVLLSWCRSGRIFAECARKGFGGLRRAHRAIQTDDACELASETVAEGIAYFRDKVLIPRHWDPRRGASLRTFFVGACILCFAKVYRGWCRETRRFPTPDSPSIVVAELHPLILSEVRDALAAVPDSDAELLSHVAVGRSHQEVAVLMQLTPKAVERRVQRARARLSELL